MASGRNSLNGSGNQEIYLNVYYASYSLGGNYSNWYWEVRYYGNGWGSWSGATFHWGLTGFASTNRTWSIPQSAAYDTYTILGNGYFKKYHNSDGYLTETNLRAWIDTSHPSIGDGDISLYPGSAPRIPKVPSPPPMAQFVSSESDSITFQIFAPSDNGGSAIESYSIYVHTKNPDGTYTAVKGWWSGSSFQTADGLDPATEYYVQYRARNGVGTGGWSTISGPMTTESGIYVSDGENWFGVGPRVSDGSQWINGAPVISNGTAWEEPLDVDV